MELLQLLVMLFERPLSTLALLLLIAALMAVAAWTCDSPGVCAAALTATCVPGALLFLWTWDWEQRRRVPPPTADEDRGETYDGRSEL